MKPTILITNDDGIESALMHVLADALAGYFNIMVVAPESEQSWIGRAMSRRSKLKIKAYDELPWPAKSITGTPTDCVNIALGHLLDTPPVAVVSGFNIGYNTTIPLIYSSGTVAGALEGAFWGLPAFALSQAIPDTLFEPLTHSKGQLPEEMRETIQENALHAAKWISETLNQPPEIDPIVHNLNYPDHMKSNRYIEQTIPAQLRQLSLFKQLTPTEYTFAFQHGEEIAIDARTDRAALRDGNISHSILNFSSLAKAK